MGIARHLKVKEARYGLFNLHKSHTWNDSVEEQSTNNLEKD